MVIQIGDVSVSIPVGIDKWAHESEDNMVEFNAMIETMMYAVNKTMKARYSSGPYQAVYEKQLKELKELGFSDEQAEKSIRSMVDVALNSEAKDTDELKNNIMAEVFKTLVS